MKKTKTILIVCFLSMILGHHYAQAEKISFKFSYNTNSVMKGDVSTWMDSFNELWLDWQSSKGGILDGQLDRLKYGYSWELELRIPLFSGLALNLGASQLKSDTTGTIQLDQADSDASEIHSISNKVTALPLKIGFSYSFRLPFFSHLAICIGGGRLILFGNYETSERYDLFFQEGGEEYNFWYERFNEYKSESLGLYATAALEYELFKNLAIVVEAEKKWAEMDGFKGPFTYQDYLMENDESGKASLYFYESRQWSLGKYYAVLNGHKRRPEMEYVRNVRQGELNFGGYSFKLGIRIIF